MVSTRLVLNVKLTLSGCQPLRGNQGSMLLLASIFQTLCAKSDETKEGLTDLASVFNGRNNQVAQ